jgi:hypothetical protein
MELIAPQEQSKNHTRARQLTLACFSPPVMLATMAIEGALAIYVLARYRHGLFAKTAALLLVLLGIFQFAEYQVCGNQNADFWSRFGLVAITLLPIVGLQLISLVTKKHHFLAIGCAMAAVFALVFVFIPESVTNAFCGGNYVVFSGPTALYEFYGAYYFTFLMFAIWEALEAMHNNQKRILRQVLKWIIIGYLSFMIPMAIVYAIYAPARIAVASVMCGFAVVLAFILAFQIVPKYYRYRYQRK